LDVVGFVHTEAGVEDEEEDDEEEAEVINSAAGGSKEVEEEDAIEQGVTACKRQRTIAQ
jgi:hypothetical protein